jgi:hypothetical protein
MGSPFDAACGSPYEVGPATSSERYTYIAARAESDAENSYGSEPQEELGIINQNEWSNEIPEVPSFDDPSSEFTDYSPLDYLEETPLYGP